MIQEKFKLTDITIQNLPLPAVGQTTMHLDTIVPSFGVRVSAGGAKTFVVQGRIKGEKCSTRLKIGRVGVITLADARERAREFLAVMEAGRHPEDVRKTQQREREAQDEATRVAAGHSFANVRERFLKEYCRGNLKPRTEETYRHRLHLAEFKAWEARPIASITREDAEDLLERVKANHPARVKGKNGYTAGSVKRSASAMWNKFAIKKRLATVNPFAGIEQTKAERRQRVLKPVELYALWRAFSAGLRLSARTKYILD